jgi:hypothetical protein
LSEASTISKALVAMGKGAESTALVPIEKVIGNGAKETAKHGSRIFKRIDRHREGLSLFNRLVPYQFTNGAAATIVGGSALIATTNEATKTKNRNKLGEITTGEMANMISFTRSPSLDQYMDKETSNPEEFKKQTKQNFGHVTSNTYGAEGDLVFALHNLRKG